MSPNSLRWRCPGSWQRHRCRSLCGFRSARVPHPPATPAQPREMVSGGRQARGLSTSRGLWSTSTGMARGHLSWLRATEPLLSGCSVLVELASPDPGCQRQGAADEVSAHRHGLVGNRMRRVRRCRHAMKLQAVDREVRLVQCQASTRHRGYRTGWQRSSPGGDRAAAQVAWSVPLLLHGSSPRWRSSGAWGSTRSAVVGQHLLVDALIARHHGVG